MRVKRGFLDGYKTYDPMKDGFGTADQWRTALIDRMGLEQALNVLGEIDPLKFFDLTAHATWEQIEKRYRTLAMETHPDKHPDNPNAEEDFKKVQAAFEILLDRFIIRDQPTHRNLVPEIK